MDNDKQTKDCTSQSKRCAPAQQKKNSAVHEEGKSGMLLWKARAYPTCMDLYLLM